MYEKEEEKDTYNQDVDAETFGHALPDQLVSDLTFLQQPLHPWAFLCTLWAQVIVRAGQVSSGGSDPQHCTVCLAEQSLLFHAGGGGYVTHFMELLTWLWVCVDSGHLNHSMRDEKQSVHQKLNSGSVEGFLIWLELDLIVPVWSEKKFKILTLLCYVHCCIFQRGSSVFPQDEKHYKT